MSLEIVAIARFLAANREMKHLVTSWRRDLTAKRFDPDQPRVPKGSPDGGQWTKIGEAIEVGGGRGRDRRPTPLRQLELQMLRAERDLAVQRAREIDPAWRPPARATDPNAYEGVFRGLRAERAEAEAFVRDATRPIWEITNPGGQPIGIVYRSATPEIRTVTPLEFQTVVGRLMAAAQRVQPDQLPGGLMRYGGSVYRRRDGALFGFRFSEGSGWTIDVFQPRPWPQNHVQRIHQR